MIFFILYLTWHYTQKEGEPTLFIARVKSNTLHSNYV